MAEKFLFLCFVKFSSNFAKLKIKIFVKLLKRKILQPTFVGVRASSAITKIVLYSSSVYTVFHSVIYNSVVLTLFAVTAIQYF